MTRTDEVPKQETLAFLRKREQEKQALLDKRFTGALEAFDRIVARIRDTCHPTRIWQWGSLLSRHDFTAISDIDIAIEGLRSPRDLFEVLRFCDDITDIPVDIVELDRIEPEFAALIRRKGRLVYGDL